VGHFGPPGSGSVFPMQIRIQNPEIQIQNFQKVSYITVVHFKRLDSGPDSLQNMNLGPFVSATLVSGFRVRILCFLDPNFVIWIGYITDAESEKELKSG
jgi:hypothetical protein